MRNKHIAALAIAGLLGMGVTTLAATSAYAAEQPGDKVCTAPETHTELAYDLQRSDWVAGEPAVPAAPASIAEGWYTEPDDAAPVATEDGLVFTAPGGQAVGVRTATSFPLADLTGESYTDVFHDRAVLDADGEPFGAGNWRNDYTSLTFLSADMVYVSGLNVTMTLDEVKAAYTGTITSFGYHMDSNAAAGTTAVVTGEPYVPGVAEIPAVPDSYTDWYVVSSGQGVALPDGHADGEEFQTDALYRYVVTGEVEVTVDVEVECPATEEPTPSEEPEPSEEPTPSEQPAPSETPAPAATSSSTDVEELAETGVNDTALLIAGGVGLLFVAGGIAFLAVYRPGRKADHRA